MGKKSRVLYYESEITEKTEVMRSNQPKILAFCQNNFCDFRLNKNCGRFAIGSKPAVLSTSLFSDKTKLSTPGQTKKVFESLWNILNMHAIYIILYMCIVQCASNLTKESHSNLKLAELRNFFLLNVDSSHRLDNSNFIHKLNIIFKKL